MIRIFCVFSFLFVSRLYAVEISAEAKKYFSNPEYSNVSISPSGRYLSYISPDPNLSLFVYDFDTGKIRSIAGRASSDDRNESMTFRAHKQDIVNPIWISDQYLIYEVVERDIESNGWFYSDADLTFSRRIGSAGYSSLLDRLPNDPSKFLVIDDEKESDKHFFPDVFLVDVKKTKRKLVVKNPGNVERWATDENGIVRLGVIDQGANYEFIYRVAEKSSWQKLDTPDSSRFLAMLDNGKLLLISAIIEGDTESLWIFNPIENKLVSKVSSDPEYDLISDVSRLLRSQDSNNLVGLLYHRDKPEIKWFNPTYKQFAEVINKLLPNTTNRIIGFNPKQRLVLAECWSDREPGFVCSYNLDNNQISPLLKYRPDIDAEKEHSKIPIKFASRDGQNIHGYVTIPRGQKGPHPLIVYSHGGPFTRDTFDWDPVVQFFSTAGYAVLQVNYRGSEGYGSHYCPKRLLKSQRFRSTTSSMG